MPGPDEDDAFVWFYTLFIQNNSTLYYMENIWMYFVYMSENGQVYFAQIKTSKPFIHAFRYDLAWM